jgi:hypothetical protein
MTIFCRVVVMIVTVWLLSALISIPPLLGWRKGRNQHFSIQCQNTISGFLVLLYLMHKSLTVQNRVKHSYWTRPCLKLLCCLNGSFCVVLRLLIFQDKCSNFRLKF